MHVGAFPVDPDAFAGNGQDLGDDRRRLSGTRDLERLWRPCTLHRNGQRFGFFSRTTRRDRLPDPLSAFPFAFAHAPEKRHRTFRVGGFGGELREQPGVRRRARADSQHAEIRVALRRYLDRLRGPLLAVEVQDLILHAGAFPDRHDQRAGFAASFVERGDQRRARGPNSVSPSFNSGSSPAGSVSPSAGTRGASRKAPPDLRTSSASCEPPPSADTVPTSTPEPAGVS